MDKYRRTSMLIIFPIIIQNDFKIQTVSLASLSNNFLTYAVSYASHHRRDSPWNGLSAGNVWACPSEVPDT